MAPPPAVPITGGINWLLDTDVSAYMYFDFFTRVKHRDKLASEYYRNL